MAIYAHANGGQVTERMPTCYPTIESRSWIHKDVGCLTNFATLLVLE